MLSTAVGDNLSAVAQGIRATPVGNNTNFLFSNSCKLSNEANNFSDTAAS